MATVLAANAVLAEAAINQMNHHPLLALGLLSLMAPAELFNRASAELPVLGFRAFLIWAVKQAGFIDLLADVADSYADFALPLHGVPYLHMVEAVVHNRGRELSPPPPSARPPPGAGSRVISPEGKRHGAQ